MIISSKKSKAEINAFGEMVSYVNDGKEYVWNGDAEFWSGHAPTLFPYCGRIKGERISYCGKEFEGQTIHGFARKQTHGVVSCNENRIVTVLTENAQTLERYPFPFELKTEYTVLDGGYTVAYTVKNTGNGNLPFCIGSHPAYMIPGRLEDCDLIVKVAENAVYYATDEAGLCRDDLVMGTMNGPLPLSFDLFERRGMVYPSLEKGTSFSVVNRVSGKGFTVELGDFPACVLWMPKENCPFICVEPWCGLPDRSDADGIFENKAYVQMLAPGKSREFKYSFVLIEG
jgi:galactose mutarotase-like enzyme